MAKLYFRYSAMNAGKSTSLLQVAHNYEEHGQTVWLYTAAIDSRHGVGKITSRLGAQRDARVFDGETNFLNEAPTETANESGKSESRQVACVLIDEAQFLGPMQVQQLHRLAQIHGIPVICYGIRTDFRGEPFPGSTYLLALADDIEEIKNICTCGKKATMNIRFDSTGKKLTAGEQISIGGNERYRQACGRCFYEE